MRLLADENVPGDVVASLRDRGHDVKWVRTDAPGLADPLVLALAQAESRVVLTFDKDFGELAFRARLPASAGVVLVRVPASPGETVRHVLAALAARDDWAGHFSVIERDRIRMIPLPSLARS